MIEYEPVDEILESAVRRRATSVGVAPSFDELAGRVGEVGEIGETDRSPGVRRGAILVLAVVAAVITLVVLRPGGDDLATTDPADQPGTTVVDVAEAFVKGVFEGGDPAALTSLMTSDAVIYDAGRLDTDGGRRALVGLVEYHAVLGSRLTRLDCEPTDEFPSGATPVPEEGGEVTAALCVLAYTHAFYEAAGLASSPEGTMYIRIQDGLMFDSPQGPPPRDGEVESHFRAWAYSELGLDPVGEACPSWLTFRDAACAQLILDNLDAWARAWHADRAS
jgi:hypothetical protein